jgi:hypothetical protein
MKLLDTGSGNTKIRKNNRDTKIRGDNSDIENLKHKGCIIGLKYKLAKGQNVNPLDEVFIVKTDAIPLLNVA